jgi:ABC-type uncharacterized transport system involved in gliding motility auxiliary subunit
MTGLASLLGALGLVGIVFAFLSFLVALFSGVPLAGDFGWIGGNLVVGIALLASAAALNVDGLRERLASGEARRAGKYGTSAIVSTLLGIVILGMIGFLGARNPVKFDWSEQKVHTLSDQTQKTLAGLESDVEVQVLVNKLDEEPLRNLLDRYAYASERFQVEYTDPNVRPGVIEEMAITPEQLGQGRGFVRMTYGKNKVDLTQIDEESVTNGIVKLTRTGERVVYFLEGHNEKPVEGEAGGGRTGYAQAAQALRNENYGVETLLLASVGDVPEDADVVVVAAPTRALLDVETEALDRYLARGGALLALVDPRVRTEWVSQLGTWGVEVADNVVIDRTLAMFGRAMAPFAARYSQTHEITRDLREPALFNEVRSVRGKAGFEDLVFTGDQSWGETDFAMLDGEGKVALDDGDVPGPVAIAAAGRPELPVEPEAGAEPRLVVFGDADFASNEYLDVYLNRDLFLNSVNWLMGDVEAIAVRPNRSRASRFQLTADQFRTIRSLSLFVLPEAIAVLGVFTWWRRRNPS